MPRFSVVVPTRDRPDLLEFCLGSLAEQTFDDFEVVVADNPVHAPAREVFDRCARPRLALHPAGRAGGDARQLRARVRRGLGRVRRGRSSTRRCCTRPRSSSPRGRSEHEPDVDIVTWRNEGYNPVDEAARPRRGALLPAATIGRAARSTTRPRSSPSAWPTASVAATTRCTTSAARSSSAPTRVRCSSASARRPGVSSTHSRPTTPRWCPRACSPSGALDVGRPLLLSYNSARSNGQRQSLDPAHARRFIEAIDPAIVDALPIPGLYTSLHNVVAYDLVSARPRAARPAATPPLDMREPRPARPGGPCRGDLARRGRARRAVRAARGRRADTRRDTRPGSRADGVARRGSPARFLAARRAPRAAGLPVAARRGARGRSALRGGASS